MLSVQIFGQTKGKDYNGVFGKEALQIRQASIGGKYIEDVQNSSDAVISERGKQQDKRSPLEGEIKAVLHVAVFVYCRP